MKKREKGGEEVNKRVQNNRGVSLVELLVTIVILAIIVLPLLRSFTISASTNAKAKERLRATDVAQNIMEGLAATDLESLAIEMNYPGTGFTDFSLIPVTSEMGNFAVEEVIKQTGSGVSYTPAVKADNITVPPGLTNPEAYVLPLVTSSVLRMQGSADTTFVGTSGEYYFAMKGLVADGKEYDALISVTKSTDTSGTMYNGVNINSHDLASVDAIDGSHDAVSSAAKTADEVYTEIKSKYPTVSQSAISRTITIDISDVSGSSGSYTKVTVSYQFTFQNGSDTVTYPDNSVTSGIYTDVIFENSGETDTRALSNVYLFYYPWYTSTSAASPTDKIVINNTAKKEVGVYLVKQEQSYSNLEVLENAYRVNVDVKEPMTSSDTATKTSIRTNLNTNLSTGAATTDDQTVLSLNGVQAGASSKLSLGSLTETSAQDRLFDVVVEVYPSGSYDNGFNGATAILSLTGGMVN
jgi:prepilin-type N-terminal cleavage/methylation domain-containing protein